MFAIPPTASAVKPLAPYTVLATLTALDPMSHHDPTRSLTTNVMPFLRRDQLVARDEDAAQVAQAQLDRVLARYPVPSAIFEFFETLTPPQFLATALVFSFVDQYRSQEGAGLFSGMERYARLSARIEAAASRTDNLYAFWSDLARLMQVGGEGERSPALLTLLSMPRSLGRLVLAALLTEAEATVMLAREWADSVRLQSAEYAAQLKRDPLPADTTTLAFNATYLPAPTRTIVRPVPAISGNAVRHIIREAGMLHLLDRLGIGLETLPAPVGFLLANGGTIRKGGKAPANSEMVGQGVLRRYPFLELLSGAVDSFLLPESVLRVNAWTVCVENAEALRPWGITPEHAGEWLVSQVTHTRHPERWDESPSVFGFETLVAGAQVAVRFGLTAYASALAAGALGAALIWLAERDVRIGGGGARGYSLMRLAVDLADLDQERAAYETYLADNRAGLREGLLDGTLGSGSRLVGA